MRKWFKRFLKNAPLRIVLGALLFIPAIVLEHLGFNTVSFSLFITALLISGITVFIDAIKGIIRRDFLDEKFLMSVASVGAVIIGEAEEGVAVMLFFLVGEWFEHTAVRSSRKSIKSLMDIRPDTASVIRNGVESIEDAEDVEVGETVIVRSGERVPLDCKILSGHTDVDTSALTGEAIPLSVTVGDIIHSGTVVIGGVITCEAIRPAEESAASRILDLVENASDRKSKEESFITKFSKIYTPLVTFLALFMAIIPPLFKWLSWGDSIYRALSFLVVSCPCALVISVPMAFFGGIGAAASEGILFKGGNVFSPLAKAKKIIFDKTGTLTTGKLSVSKIKAIGLQEDELVSLCASAEYASNHPIAECLKRMTDKITVPDNVIELPGRGVCAEISNDTVLVGNLKLMSEYKIEADGAAPGAVLVAKNGVFVGWIAFADTVKDEAADAIERMRRQGTATTYILSGDKKENVSSISDRLGIDVVHSELLPEDKFSLLEKIIGSKQCDKVIYVGDGINDAPCIARADVGVAMGAIGSDSAIEAADLVIMSDNLMKLPRAVSLARKTLAIAKQNIIFAIGIKVLVLLLVSFNIAGMWMAVFADVGVAVLAILNSMRMLLRKRNT